jgi:hypothetical protein
MFKLTIIPESRDGLRAHGFEGGKWKVECGMWNVDLTTFYSLLSTFRRMAPGTLSEGEL